MALGVIRGVRYQPRRVRLDHGDTLFLYTDGVTEAMDAAGELFSPHRLEAALAGVASEGPRELTDAIFSAVNDYAQGVPQSDDITTLTVRLH